MVNFGLPLTWRTASIDSTVAIIQVNKCTFCSLFNYIANFMDSLVDWACGGQWNRAYQFVQLLANAFNVAHIEVIAFFDGTLKEHKKQSFERNQFRQKTISVLKHIRMIGTPPPKIWWLPPSGIRTCLRNAMRNLSIQVVS